MCLSGGKNTEFTKNKDKAVQFYIFEENQLLMKYLPYLMLIFLTGCSKEHEPKIEIYLLNKPVVSYEGTDVFENRNI